MAENRNEKGRGRLGYEDYRTFLEAFVQGVRHRLGDRLLAVVLYGSVARGIATPESDIDLLVQFEKPVGFFGFIELEDYLSEKLGAKVDLVTEDALKPLIRPYVMETIAYV